MIFIILGLVTASGIIWRKSKWVSLLIIAFDIILCVGCSKSYDLINLRNMYEQPEQFHEDVALGWDFFFRACIKVGIPWLWFKAICATVSLGLLYFSMKRTTGADNLVLSIYTISLLMFQMTQIRNGLAFSFVLFGATFLINKERGAVFKYLLFLLIATLIHYSMIIYAILIFALFAQDRKKYFVRLLFILAVIVVLMVTNAMALIGNKLLSGHERIIQYLDFSKSINAIDSSSIKSLLIYWAVQTVILLSSTMIMNYKQTIAAKNLYIVSSQEQRMHSMLVLTILFAPLIVLSLSYFRLVRNMVVLLYMQTATIPPLQASADKTERRLSSIIVFVIGLAIWLLAAYMEGEGFTVLNSFSL